VFRIAGSPVKLGPIPAIPRTLNDTGVQQKSLNRDVGRTDEHPTEIQINPLVSTFHGDETQFGLEGFLEIRNASVYTSTNSILL
jgi:hypothetical protein